MEEKLNLSLHCQLQRLSFASAAAVVDLCVVAELLQFDRRRFLHLLTRKISSLPSLSAHLMCYSSRLLFLKIAKQKRRKKK
jgi:hypothetical protein